MPVGHTESKWFWNARIGVSPTWGTEPLPRPGVSVCPLRAPSNLGETTGRAPSAASVVASVVAFVVATVRRLVS